MTVQGKPILRDVTFALPAVGMTALMGPVGTGKSTLLKWLCMKADPAIYAAQVRQAVYFHAPLSRRNHPPLFAQRQAMTIDQMMLSFDVMLSTNPPLICVDEPTVGMTAQDVARLMDRLTRIAQGRSVLLISHDQRLVRDHADHVLLLAGGRVQENTPAAEFFAHARTEAGRQFVGTGWTNVPGLDTPAHHLSPEMRALPDALGLRVIGAEGRLLSVLDRRILVYDCPDTPGHLATDAPALAAAGVATLVSLAALPGADQLTLRATGIAGWQVPRGIATGTLALDRARCKALQAELDSRGALAFLRRPGDRDTAIAIAMQLIQDGIRADASAAMAARLCDLPALAPETENRLYDLELSLDLERDGADPDAFVLDQPDISWIEAQLAQRKGAAK